MTSLSAGWVARAGVLALITAACSSQSAQERTTAEPKPQPSEAASTVKGDQLDQAPKDQIEKMLEGRIAGVDVTQTPDGGIAVRIRGATSGYNNEPLYIIDGMAVQPGPTGALTGINPRDIESIRVLKNAAETAMYGSRGANGVVIIKTKRAK
jgi:TonB-dependent SusC/RagA subfamily outer membrane receptor